MYVLRVGILGIGRRTRSSARSAKLCGRDNDKLLVLMGLSRFRITVLRALAVS